MMQIRKKIQTITTPCYALAKTLAFSVLLFSFINTPNPQYPFPLRIMPISHPILFPLQTAEYHSEKSQIGRISKHDLIIKNLLIGFSCSMIELYSIHSTKKPVGNLSISSHCPKQWQYSPLIIRKKIPLDLSLKRLVIFSALGVIRTHGPLLRN